MPLQELASLGLGSEGVGRSVSGTGGDAAMGEAADRGVLAAQGERLAFEAIRAAHPPTSKVGLRQAARLFARPLTWTLSAWAPHLRSSRSAMKERFLPP